MRAVGQDVSPESVFLASKAVRKSMRRWDVAGDGRPWKVELDVRDLGDLTCRARAGTLSRRVKEATQGVSVVGALPLGFQVKLGLVWEGRRWSRCLASKMPMARHACVA